MGVGEGGGECSCHLLSVSLKHSDDVNNDLLSLLNRMATMTITKK